LDKKYSSLLIASILILALALGMTVYIVMQKNKFNKMVHESLKTSEGYDRDFIAMVEHLELLLATRASFGYEGGKDPMTGKIRKVVLEVKKKAIKAVAKRESAASVSAEPVDPFKLTAIIFEEEKSRYTAVVMDGERSYSVEVGDRIKDRKITRITDEVLIMEDDQKFFMYDIYGRSTSKSK